MMCFTQTPIKELFNDISLLHVKILNISLIIHYSMIILIYLFALDFRIVV